MSLLVAGSCTALQDSAASLLASWHFQQATRAGQVGWGGEALEVKVRVVGKKFHNLGG